MAELRRVCLRVGLGQFLEWFQPETCLQVPVSCCSIDSARGHDAYFFYFPSGDQTCPVRWVCRCPGGTFLGRHFTRKQGAGPWIISRVLCRVLALHPPLILRTTPWTPLSLFLQRKRLRFVIAKETRPGFLQPGSRAYYSPPLRSLGARPFPNPEPYRTFSQLSELWSHHFLAFLALALIVQLKITHLLYRSGAHCSLASVHPWLPEASSGKGPRTSSLRSPQAGGLSAPLSCFSWQHLCVPACQGSHLTQLKAKPELVLVLPALSVLALPPLPASLVQHGGQGGWHQLEKEQS